MKLFILSLSLVFSLVTNAGGRNGGSSGRFEPGYGQTPVEAVAPAPTDDSKLVQAIASHRNVYFLEAAKLKVTQLLRDDTQGLPHQKFKVVTSHGDQVLCVYNLDQGQRIPLKIGDEVGVGGEFKMTNVGPMMHWLHEDSSNKRPDGYVELAGRRYGLN
jgi:hypothetical protein